MLRLAPILASLAAVDVGHLAHRAKRNAILYALAGLLLLTAYVAAVVAAGIRLAAETGAVEAALLVAAAGILLALALIATVLILNRIDRKRRRGHAASRQLLATAAIALAPALVRSRLLMSLAAVGGLAFLAFRSAGTDEGDE